MNKRMKMFLTICGIVVGTGLILSIVGAALGGIGSLSRVEDRVPWISLTYGQGENQRIAAESFSSIDVDADLGQVELMEGQQFAVEVSYEKRAGVPKVSVENGILNVRPADHR
ncbi:hypothetical protein NE619_05390 [Anaerovorax odorimutans]|uniref:Uncharacterized protein n=1 Tax=Anaerovorax odorimutans TaxID=109327 RepID=A0ABT1RLU1_9FIRM|nr:hypothetical protein [Anaerovorax odorimutans]MCQ4636153.1 hypothetical protein [Anaerovorax odorimutans]